MRMIAAVFDLFEERSDQEVEFFECVRTRRRIRGRGGAGEAMLETPRPSAAHCVGVLAGDRAVSLFCVQLSTGRIGS